MAPEYKTSEEILAAYERRSAGAHRNEESEQDKLPSYQSASDILKTLRRSMA